MKRKNPNFFGTPFRATMNELDTAARHWLEDRPLAWSLLVEVTHELAKDGVKFSLKLVHEMLRHRFKVKGLGRMASNSYTTYFVRLLCDWEPALADLLTGQKEEPARFDALEDL